MPETTVILRYKNPKYGHDARIYVDRKNKYKDIEHPEIWWESGEYCFEVWDRFPWDQGGMSAADLVEAYSIVGSTDIIACDYSDGSSEGAYYMMIKGKPKCVYRAEIDGGTLLKRYGLDIYAERETLDDENEFEESCLIKIFEHFTSTNSSDGVVLTLNNNQKGLIVSALKLYIQDNPNKKEDIESLLREIDE